MRTTYCQADLTETHADDSFEGPDLLVRLYLVCIPSVETLVDRCVRITAAQLPTDPDSSRGGVYLHCFIMPLPNHV